MSRLDRPELTQKLLPLVRRAHLELGAIFCCLLESRWKVRTPTVHAVLAGALGVTSSPAAFTKKWDRWKSVDRKDRVPIFAHDPNTIHSAIDWARQTRHSGKALLSEEEACDFSDAFSTVLDWTRVQRSDDPPAEVDKILRVAFGIGKVDPLSTTTVRDLITQETLRIVSGQVVSKSTAANAATRTKKETAVREAALKLITACDNLLVETLGENEVLSVPQRKARATYQEKTAVYNRFVGEATALLDAIASRCGRSSVEQLLKELELYGEQNGYL